MLGPEQTSTVDDGLYKEFIQIAIETGNVDELLSNLDDLVSRTGLPPQTITQALITGSLAGYQDFINQYISTADIIGCLSSFPNKSKPLDRQHPAYDTTLASTVFQNQSNTPNQQVDQRIQDQFPQTENDMNLKRLIALKSTPNSNFFSDEIVPELRKQNINPLVLLLEKGMQASAVKLFNSSAAPADLMAQKNLSDIFTGEEITNAILYALDHDMLTTAYLLANQYQSQRHQSLSIPALAPHEIHEPLFPPANNKLFEEAIVASAKDNPDEQSKHQERINILSMICNQRDVILTLEQNHPGTNVYREICKHKFQSSFNPFSMSPPKQNGYPHMIQLNKLAKDFKLLEKHMLTNNFAEIDKWGNPSTPIEFRQGVLAPFLSTILPTLIKQNNQAAIEYLLNQPAFTIETKDADILFDYIKEKAPNLAQHYRIDLYKQILEGDVSAYDQYFNPNTLELIGLPQAIFHYPDPFLQEALYKKIIELSSKLEKDPSNSELEDRLILYTNALDTILAISNFSSGAAGITRNCRMSYNLYELTGKNLTEFVCENYLPKLNHAVAKLYSMHYGATNHKLRYALELAVEHSNAGFLVTMLRNNPGSHPLTQKIKIDAHHLAMMINHASLEDISELFMSYPQAALDLDFTKLPPMKDFEKFMHEGKGDIMAWINQLPESPEKMTLSNSLAVQHELQRRATQQQARQQVLHAANMSDKQEASPSSMQISNSPSKRPKQ